MPSKPPISREAMEVMMLEFEDFINEPPQYEESYKVRDYRHQLYPKWRKLHEALMATLGVLIVDGVMVPREQMLTATEAAVCAKALRNGLSPSCKLYIPNGWNVLLEKLDMLAASQAGNEGEKG